MQRRNKWLKLALPVCILFLMVALVTSGAEAGTRGKIRAEKLKYFKEQGYFVAEGNAQTLYKDYVITSDAVQYYEKEDRAIFTGNVTVIQGMNRITGQIMAANMKTDEFVIDGNVYIYYVRKEKDGVAKTADKLTKKDIVELQAAHVVYQSRNDQDHLNASGNVVMKTDEDVVKCTNLEYKGGDEVIFARDNVEVTRKSDDKLVCSEFTYRLEGADEGFDAVGQVNLEFTIDDEDNATTPATTPTTNPVTPAPAGGTKPAPGQQIQPNPQDKPQTTPNTQTGQAPSNKTAKPASTSQKPAPTQPQPKKSGK